VTETTIAHRLIEARSKARLTHNKIPKARVSRDDMNEIKFIHNRFGMTFENGMDFCGFIITEDPALTGDPIVELS
jgi:hypothetical protein